MQHIVHGEISERPRIKTSKYGLPSLFAALLLLANCTPVPYGKSFTSKAAYQEFETFQSTAVATKRTAGPVSAGYLPTGIVPLKDGGTALRVRLEMMDRAQDTLDVSAFIIREDNAGYLFADRMVQAADRGVKVRLLLDDLFNQWTAVKFLALDRHPNIEIRIFNPFSRFSPPQVGFLLEYDRVSRRMHSRMMVADDQEAILGGRNIADEYFSDNGRSAFTDFEILARGSVTQQFSRSFQMYWSDPWTIPLRRISPWDYSSQFKRLLKELAVKCEEARDNKYSAVFGAEPALLNRDSLPRFDAQAQFVTDMPDKVRQDQSEAPYLVAESHFRAIAKAEREVLIVTPYFIPEDHGAQVLEAIAARGVKVTIVTNSLASTNHTAVHGGYSTYRDRLIRTGVIFHELNPNPQPGQSGSGVKNTLHAKFTVIDGSQTIVTTMNFDPVSIRGNLETSLVVRGRTFAKWMLRQVNPISLNQTYRLSVKDNGPLVWLRQSGAGSAHEIAEPGANIARRFISGVSQFLNLESML